MLVSGGLDRQVRFWDVRASSLSMSIGGKTSIAGDAVDMSHCNNYCVTGGGTLGEGVQVWDLRALDAPVIKYLWGKHENGDDNNPIVNCVRFVPRQDVVLAGCSDENLSAKCFDFKTGETIHEFENVAGNCFSLDVAQDGKLCSFGDANGTIHTENIHY